MALWGEGRRERYPSVRTECSARAATYVSPLPSPGFSRHRLQHLAHTGGYELQLLLRQGGTARNVKASRRCVVGFRALVGPRPSLALEDLLHVGGDEALARLDAALGQGPHDRVTLANGGPPHGDVVHPVHVTGIRLLDRHLQRGEVAKAAGVESRQRALALDDGFDALELCAARSEERRVGKECRSRWSPYH